MHVPKAKVVIPRVKTSNVQAEKYILFDMLKKTRHKNHNKAVMEKQTPLMPSFISSSNSS